MKKHVLFFAMGVMVTAGLSGSYITYDRKWQAEQMQIKHQAEQLKKEREKHEELSRILNIERSMFAMTTN